MATTLWNKIWSFLAPPPPGDTVTSEFFYGTTTLAPTVWSSSNSLCEIDLPV